MKSDWNNKSPKLPESKGARKRARASVRDVLAKQAEASNALSDEDALWAQVEKARTINDLVEVWRRAWKQGEHGFMPELAVADRKRLGLLLRGVSANASDARIAATLIAEALTHWPELLYHLQQNAGLKSGAKPSKPSTSLLYGYRVPIYAWIEDRLQSDVVLGEHEEAASPKESVAWSNLKA